LHTAPHPHTHIHPLHNNGRYLAFYTITRYVLPYTPLVPVPSFLELFTFCWSRESGFWNFL
jgi:hypothetical protein